VIIAVAALAAGQRWASAQDGDYAGFVPVVFIGALCAWRYRQEMRTR
jgi:hypothetical protein